MQASTLVKIDLDGAVIDGTGDEDLDKINKAGFVIHSAIHRARPDVACVIHTHTAAGIAVSAQKHGLLPISQHALRFHNAMAYHDYEGIALDLDEQERLVADLGPHRAMILRNHGLLVAGRTIPEAFVLIYYLEMACKIQVQAMAGGGELNIPSDKALARTYEQYNRNGDAKRFEFLWHSALPLIEGNDPPYWL
jgi:ribulose-5-phosphate 4-epimerase/fuculose-1-phosphate aldolase